MGLLPTYAQIGMWAPILLLLMRVIQGAAIGGIGRVTGIMAEISHATQEQGAGIEQVNRAIERTGATRVVIDSLSEMGLYLAPEFRADLRLAVFRMLSQLAYRGVSVLVTVGMDDQFTDNALRNEAGITMINHQIRGMLAAIQGGT